MNSLKKALLVIGVMVASVNLSAQWRLGVYGGGDWFQRTIDYGYVTNMERGQYRHSTSIRMNEHHNIHCPWSGDVGLMAQYNFYDWLGIRADVTWQQRNYYECRHLMANYIDTIAYSNNYLVIPIMLHFSVGNQIVRGYANIGGYWGFNLFDQWAIHSTNIQQSRYYEVWGQNLEQNFAMPKRMDAGLAGSIGVQYKFHSNIALFAEVGVYYGLLDNHPTGSRYFKQPEYDTTITFNLGFAYLFDKRNK